MPLCIKITAYSKITKYLRFLLLYIKTNVLAKMSCTFELSIKKYNLCKCIYVYVNVIYLVNVQGMGWVGIRILQTPFSRFSRMQLLQQKLGIELNALLIYHTAFLSYYMYRRIPLFFHRLVCAETDNDGPRSWNI